MTPRRRSLNDGRRADQWEHWCSAWRRRELAGNFLCQLHETGALDSPVPFDYFIDKHILPGFQTVSVFLLSSSWLSQTLLRELFEATS